MRLVLFGSTGQVGWELARSLAPLGEVIRLHRSSQDYCGDLTDPSGVARTTVLDLGFFEIFGNDELLVPIDFPADSFY